MLDELPFEGMASIPVIITPPVWCTVIAEEHQSGVVTVHPSVIIQQPSKYDSPFRCMGKKIEKRVIIKQEVIWVARLGADDIWALYWVPAEENWLCIC